MRPCLQRSQNNHGKGLKKDNTGKLTLMRILHVVDQYSSQSAELVAALGRRGARISHVTRSDLSWPIIRDADIVLLCPRLSGEECSGICSEVRYISDIPIIMISDRAEGVDPLEGFRAGADHYIGRPRHLDELVAKIIATTRPRGGTNDQIWARPKTRRIGDIEIDVERMTVSVAGAATELTKKEFQLLMSIIRENGAACPREKIAAEVWGRPEAEVCDSIQVLMSRLRAKLGRDHIKTVRNVGYRIATPSHVSAPSPPTNGRSW